MTYIERLDAFVRGLNLDSYRVGGSVRDELLGRKIKDGDYMIREDLQVVYSRLRTAGKNVDKFKITKLKLRDGRHVGWRVAGKGLGLIEITLPRTDVSTGPGRHDFEIVTDPTLSIEEDALRRDFTFNALYKRLDDGEIIDPLNGVEALNNKEIHLTYFHSFRDDPLRMLRALRFVSVLGFTIPDETYLHMMMNHTSITGLTQKGVSGTALDELCKILMGSYPADALRVARDTGVLETLLPELKDMLGFQQESKYHDMSVDEHTFHAIQMAANFNSPLRVRMALLFHDSGKPEVAWRGQDNRLHYYQHKDFPDSEDHEVASARRAASALSRLNAERSLRRDVDLLVRNHMVSTSGRTKASKVRKWRTKFGDSLLQDLFRHRLCDEMGKGTINNDSLEAIMRLEAIRADAHSKAIPTSVKELKTQRLIDGQDIMALGVTGSGVGKILEQLLHEVVSQPKLLEREWLLQRAAKLAKTYSKEC